MRIYWIRIRIRIRQFKRIWMDPDPGFWWRKIEEKNAAENVFYIFFRSKIVIYLSLGLHKGRLSYRRSLQPSKENIQNFKKIKIYNFFQFLWVMFALLDPGPDCESGSGYGFRGTIESGSNPAPDPQHCQNVSEKEFQSTWAKIMRNSLVATSTSTSRSSSSVSSFTLLSSSYQDNSYQYKSRDRLAVQE